jgi:hypothetical protein
VNCAADPVRFLEAARAVEQGGDPLEKLNAVVPWKIWR